MAVEFLDQTSSSGGVEFLDQKQIPKNLQDLQNQIQIDELNRTSSPLVSAVAGAASVPIGLTDLIANGIKKLIGEKTYQQAFPQSDQLSSLIQKDIEAKTGANPLSAALGSAGLNAALIASGGGLPGGTIINTGKAVGALARGEIPQASSLALQAGREAIPSSIINTGIGAGTRELTGQDQSLNSAIQDALLGVALGGNNPEAAAQLKSGIQAGGNAIINTPIVQGVGNLARGTANVVSGTTKSLVKSVLPKSVETSFVDALNPGSNPVQFQKAVQAVKTVIPNAQDVIDRSGLTFDTAAGARDISNFAKNDIWSQIEAQTGQPILADASTITDAYHTIAIDPVVKRLFPEVIPQLVAEGDKYLNQQIPIQELERTKQIFNAINQTKEALSNSKKAALEKSDPIYAATAKANDAIGQILEDQFGPEFTAQKQQYGAWKQINDLATKQAIKQEILDNKVSPFEGLGILGAVAQGVANEGGLFKGASTALAGKALKYVNSPNAKFYSLGKRLTQAQSK